jgi:hypothetical protein
MAKRDRKPEPPDASSQPGFLQMLGSVAAAFFGVQSRANRERDFRHGKPVHFILIGLGFTVTFVLILVGLVKLLLASA